MKVLSYRLGICLLLLAACKKENKGDKTTNNAPHEYEKLIIGTWQGKDIIEREYDSTGKLIGADTNRKPGTWIFSDSLVKIKEDKDSSSFKYLLVSNKSKSFLFFMEDGLAQIRSLTKQELIFVSEYAKKKGREERIYRFSR